MHCGKWEFFNKILKHMGGQHGPDDVFVADMADGSTSTKNILSKMKAPGLGGNLSDLFAFDKCQFIAFWHCTTTDSANPDFSFADDITSKQQFETAVERACADMGMETTVVQAWPLTFDCRDEVRCYFAVPIFVK